jgi:hypothetical protein
VHRSRPEVRARGQAPTRFERLATLALRGGPTIAIVVALGLIAPVVLWHERLIALLVLPLCALTLPLARGRGWAVVTWVAYGAALCAAAALGVFGADQSWPLLVALPLLLSPLAGGWRLVCVDRAAALGCLVAAAALGVVTVYMLARPGESHQSSAAKVPVSPLGPAPDPALFDAQPFATASRICSPGQRPTSRRHYEFDDDVLTPDLLGGGRVDQQAALVVGRNRDRVREAVYRREAHLSGCYRTALHGSGVGFAGAMELRFAIAPFGAVSGVRARWSERQPPEQRTDLAMPATLSARFECCVERALRGIRVVDPRPLTTHVEARLRFVRSGLLLPSAPAPQWAAPAMRSRLSSCMRLPRARRSERMVFREPLLVIDDFEWHRAQAECRRWPRRCRTTIGYCLPPAGLIPQAEFLRRRVRESLRSFADCYRRALSRRPGTSGRVVLRAVISSGGAVRRCSVASSTAGDVVLERCLARTFEALTFVPFSEKYEVVVEYPFELRPSTARAHVAPLAPRKPPTRATSRAGLETAAQRALHTGEPDLALRKYGELFARWPHAVQRRCPWIYGALEAALARAPWGNWRVRRLFTALLREASGRRGLWCSALVRKASALIVNVATTWHRHPRNEPALRRAASWYRPLRLGVAPYRIAIEAQYYRAKALLDAEGCRAAKPALEAAQLGHHAGRAARLRELCRRRRPDFRDTSGICHMRYPLEPRRSRER